MGYSQDRLIFKSNPHLVDKSHYLRNHHMPQIEFRNDLNEQLDSTQFHQWSNAQLGWVTTKSSHYTYNTDHQMATERVYFFDLDDGERYYGRQEEYFYNDSGEWNLHYTNFLDPVSGEWKKSDRYELIYDEDLLGTEYTASQWDELLSQYVYNYKLIYSYTPSGKPQGYVQFSWDGNSWKKSSKAVNEYNSADSILVTTTYNWNNSLSDWEIFYRIAYYYTNDIRLDSIVESSNSGAGLASYQKIITLYNAQDHLAQETGYLWNGSSWDLNFQNEYEYTPEGYLSVLSLYEWDPDEETFIEDYREENSYTVTGDFKTLTVSEYDTDADAWVPFFRRETFFDEQVDGATIVWPNPPDYYPPTSYHYKPVYEVESIFEFNEWSVVDTTVLFYNDIQTVTIPLSKSAISVFPNPATNQLYIQMDNLDPAASITFFDQQGRLITSRPVQASRPVNISGLLPGAYVFQIRNGVDYYSGKLLKE
jgi:hypothetical protein